MAKYPINKVGMDSFNDLAKQLGESSKNLNSYTKSLKDCYTRNESDLGYMSDDVLDIIKSMEKTQKGANTAVDGLKKFAEKKAKKIEALLKTGINV